MLLLGVPDDSDVQTCAISITVLGGWEYDGSLPILLTSGLVSLSTFLYTFFLLTRIHLFFKDPLLCSTGSCVLIISSGDIIQNVRIIRSRLGLAF